ncbi:MAG: glycosyltransferase [Crenarchaeota archaeon]|nr:glycosyltransferase [Thermoproteota archaeon]
MLAEALASVAGDMLSIKVFSTTEAGRDPYTLNGVEVVPSYERGAASYSRLLDVLAEHGGVDVLHLQHEFGIYGDTPAIIEALLEARAERLTRAAVATLHTVYHPRGVEKGLETRLSLYERSFLLDSIVVHSVLQEFELASQGAPLERLHRIPHGTSINSYVETPRQKLIELLGLPGELQRARVLAVPGFLRRDKGLATLLEAFSKVDDPAARLVVAGEPQGRGSEEVARLLEEYEAREPRLVVLRRYLSSREVLYLSALADLIVLPYEDRPGKYSVSGILHLSMGSLKPIVGTRVPRLVELYQLAPRMVVRPRSPGELAAKIRWVLQNYDETIPYMGQVYSYAVRTMWPRMARRHLSLYQSLLAAS